MLRTRPSSSWLLIEDRNDVGSVVARKICGGHLCSMLRTYSMIHEPPQFFFLQK